MFTVPKHYILLLDNGIATFASLMAFVAGFHRNAPVTFQALSEGDRKLWMEAMDGKEPVSSFLFFSLM